jgi:carboxylate-amine ligase
MTDPPGKGPMRTVGVEEELLLYDADVARAVPHGDDLADDPGASDGDPPQVEHEFKLEQAEIATAPCASLDDLATELRRRRAELIQRATERHTRIAAIATSPTRVHPHDTEDDRYQEMNEAFAAIAREQLTCGMHVHVSVTSPEEGVAVIDRIGPWLPVLLAMSANSPYWQGEDTGYASYRTLRWQLWPTAGPTEAFGSEQAYRDRVDRLVASGAALDAAMIYFDARLSATYPTVEIRVCDVTPTTDDALVIAALCRALVETLAAQWHSGEGAPPVPVSLRRAATWRAARYGLSGDLLNEQCDELLAAETMVQRLLSLVGPMLEVEGDLGRISTMVESLLVRGTGAALLRQARRRLGSLSEVVTAATRWTEGLDAVSMLR